MLPPKSRLPYEEFRVRGYREVATPYFSIKVKKNSTGENRFGVVVGVSSIKSAARRNFWRRRAKSVLVATPVKGFDVLVIFRSRVETLSLDVFRKMLSGAISSLISNL